MDNQTPEQSAQNSSQQPVSTPSPFGEATRSQTPPSQPPELSSPQTPEPSLQPPMPQTPPLEPQPVSPQPQPATPGVSAPPPQALPTPQEGVVSSYVSPHGGNSGGMKTPLLLALLTIVFVGIVGAGAFVLSQNNGQKIANVPSYTPPPQPKSTQPLSSLSIITPSDQSVVTSPNLTVNGKTSPNTLLMVYSDSDQMVVQSDATGAYQATLAINPGFNTVKVSSYPTSGNQQNQQVTVIYNDNSM